MANDFCPFINRTCRTDCAFIAHTRGVYGTLVAVCLLAEHCKDSASIAASLHTLTETKVSQ